MTAYREQWQRDSFERVGQSVGFRRLPLIGLCKLRVSDGRAILLPLNGQGVIVREWFGYCRWRRKRQKAGRE
jgi:hypothetical protein